MLYEAISSNQSKSSLRESCIRPTASTAASVLQGLPHIIGPQSVEPYCKGSSLVRGHAAQQYQGIAWGYATSVPKHENTAGSQLTYVRMYSK